MEAVGGVASVVGILAFTGQALKGLIALEGLLKDAATAEDSINSVLRSAESLQATLKEVERVIETLNKLPPAQIADRGVLETSVLDCQVRWCNKDIEAWVIMAQRLDPRSKKGFKAFLRKLKVAATGNRDLHVLGERISAHQQRIGISVSLLGRTLDILEIQQLDNLGSGLTAAHLKLNDIIQSTQSNAPGINTSQWSEESLVKMLMTQFDQRLRVSAETNEIDLNSLSESMSSIASSMSLLATRMFPVQNGINVELHDTPETQPVGKEFWSCAAALGIDDFYNDNEECVICGHRSPNFVKDGYTTTRGFHLATAHAFGDCNISILHASWVEMLDHLQKCHSLGSEVSHPALEILFKDRTGKRCFDRNHGDVGQYPLVLSERLFAINKLEAELMVLVHEKRLAANDMTAFNTLIEQNKIDPNGHIRHVFSDGISDKTHTYAWEVRQEMAGKLENMIINDEDIDSAMKDHEVLSKSDILNLWRCITWLETTHWHWSGAVPLVHTSMHANREHGKKPNFYVNCWLWNVLFYSANTRHTITRSLRPDLRSPDESTQWVVSGLMRWYDDDPDATQHLVLPTSEGAVDSRDNLTDISNQEIQVETATNILSQINKRLSIGVIRPMDSYKRRRSYSAVGSMSSKSSHPSSAGSFIENLRIQRSPMAPCLLPKLSDAEVILDG